MPEEFFIKERDGIDMAQAQSLKGMGIHPELGRGITHGSGTVFL